MLYSVRVARVSFASEVLPRLAVGNTNSSRTMAVAKKRKENLLCKPWFSGSSTSRP
jgi:hypothetical protein